MTLYISSSVLRGKNFERRFIIPIFFLVLMIFSFRCFSNDKPESSMRPKCFCSFTYATEVPLNISCEWVWTGFLARK